MFAAIPIRMAIIDRETPSEKLQIHISPSSQAKGRTARCIPYYKKFRGPLEVLGPSQFNDPLAREGQVFFPGYFTQIDYIDLVERLLSFMAKEERVIPTAWLNEILRVANDIRAERKQQETWPLGVRLWSWATWDFVLPEYDPWKLCRWDPTTKRFIDVSVVPTA